MSGDPNVGVFQLSYLQYFTTADIDTRIGRLHLFNFWRFKDTYITDERLRDKIEEICNLYCDIDLSPLSETGLTRLDGIAIAEKVNNYSFAPLSPQQVK